MFGVPRSRRTALPLQCHRRFLTLHIRTEYNILYNILCTYTHIKRIRRGEILIRAACAEGRPFDIFPSARFFYASKRFTRKNEILL